MDAPTDLPTGLGGSHTRGRNIETRELDHTEACPRTAAANDLTDAHLQPQIRYRRPLRSSSLRGFLRPATGVAVTTKDYPWISNSTSSWKSIDLEGNLLGL